MSKANGFFAVRISLALCALLAFILWAAGQYPAQVGRTASGTKAFKDYLVVWNSSSNIWLAGDSGTAAGVASIDAGYSHGVALHDDGSVTRIGLDPVTFEVTELRFESAGATLAAAGASGDTALLGFDGALRHLSDNGELMGRPADAGGVDKLVAGTGFLLALEKGGTVLSPGAEGALLPPPGLSGVAGIDAGDSFCVARRRNGSLVAWGDARVATNIASGVAAVSASRRGAHCLALNTDGTVTAWGDDGSGQCRVPAGLSGVRAVAAGGFHSVALKSDGTVTCWGMIRHAPPLLTNVVSVGASYLDAYAVTGDGTVMVWGTGCRSGCVRISAKTPGICEILDVRAVDCGIYMAVVRAEAGLLEGDADGDGVSGIDEVFLVGTDPLVKDAVAYAPIPAAAKESALEPEAVPSGSKSGLGASGASMTLDSLESGTTYYVDAAKLYDSGDGLSWENAKRTIQAAVDAAQSGDTVVVTNGVYGYGSRVTPGGLFQNRLVITNGVLVRSVNGAGATVIQGSGADFFDTWDAVRCVYITDGILDGFSLQDGATVGYWTSPADRDRSGGCLNMGEATAASEVRNCIISGGKAYDGGGVWFGSLVNCVIRSCNAYYGAATYRSALLNCTVTVNGTWECYSGGGGYYSGVTNSIVYGNTTGWESPECHYCTVSYVCSDELNFGLGNTGDNILFADPLFTDAANGDFSLQAASLCFDAGNDAYVTADTDLPGNPRIQGGAVDMGAYEILVDTDGDGVPDFRDAFPLDAAAWLDTDGDGKPDFLVCASSSQPPLVEDTDDDNDGMPDWWESMYLSCGFDPLVSAPADSSDSGKYGDIDGDGICNLDESGLGTDPSKQDTDGDGLADDVELGLLSVIEWGQPYTGADGVARPAWLTNVVAASAGTYHTVAVMPSGRVVCWGQNNYGQCVPPATLTNVAAVAAGFYHSVALRRDGTVQSWGYSNYGLLNVPAASIGITAVAAGLLHTEALRADGHVVCWGYNNRGQTNAPASLTNAVAIAAGDYHTVALKADGRVVCWGYNYYGQTNAPASLTNAVAIAAGASHTVALTSDGQVVCWGHNSYGQCNVPAGLGRVLTIGAGRYNTMVYTEDGRVVCWGNNVYGQSGSFQPGAHVAYLGGGVSASLAVAGPVNIKTDPLDPDTDGDGFDDGWEVTNGYNPVNPLYPDPYMDFDGDGLLNLLEGSIGTDAADSDDPSQGDIALNVIFPASDAILE